MSKHYQFRQNEIEQIVNRFGQAFYEKVLRDLDTFAEQWALSELQLIPSYSANLVFTCESAQFGSAVLKVGRISSAEINTEYHTLLHYDGRRFCNVYAADVVRGVMLEARVKPGNPLREETSLAARLDVFSSLYTDLHIAAANAELYPTYVDWVSKITEFMSKQPDCSELAGYMKKAEDICLSVAAVYTRQMLLHGDFHHDNILLGQGGVYQIIDPKGVIGDPVFDVPRFILNEFDDDFSQKGYAKINEIIVVLEKKLGIPSAIIKQCLFVETAMGSCWCVEDGATAEEYADLVKQVAFAESIMNS
ncbi:aminoglycoside phosphotransferase family protein [Paenibacillus sp. CF384]|uniref:aminoglycoside phosphotransferase family protein n=1 Tax=Paenibacillus sp. CF384 TaxID=1884382 RepID=UPI0008974C29|nr:aminoglycoside phosphotransferase family protein [Paenibacillus sp. CF384]SDX03804.1 streptomycin 6-kinase [Paenibacillus sp. CF384]